MNTEQERAEFEAFALEHGLCITEDDDLYRSYVIRWMWRAWQARAALAAQAQEAAPRDSLHDCALGDSNYAAGMLLGWNLCTDGRDEDFRRIREDRLRAAASASKPPAPVSPWIRLTDRMPNPDEHDRVLIYTEGYDFNGEQVFDVKAETLNESYFESPDQQPEVLRFASHWMPIPAVSALAAAQQPAEGEEIMVNTPYDVFTLPLRPSGLSSGPRFVVHVPGPEQPAPDASVLVEALELARRTLAMAAIEGEVTRRIDSALAAHRKQGGQQ